MSAVKVQGICGSMRKDSYNGLISSAGFRRLMQSCLPRRNTTIPCQRALRMQSIGPRDPMAKMPAWVGRLRSLVHLNQTHQAGNALPD
jgi:hypothetical protein